MSTWKQLGDTATILKTNVVRMHVGMTCGAIGAGMSAAGIQVACEAQPAIATVLSVDEDVSDYVAFAYPWPYGWTITFQTNDGTQAGDCRAAVQSAIAQVNSQKIIACQNFTYGAVELRADCSLTSPLACAPTSWDLGLIAVIVVAIVVLFLALNNDLKQVL